MGVAQAGWTDPSPPMRLEWERGGAISWPEVAAWAEATELVWPSSPDALLSASRRPAAARPAGEVSARKAMELVSRAKEKRR